MTEAPPRYLLCSRKDGIGARLVNLIWTWRLARAGGLRTLCFWPPMDPYYGETTGVGDLIDLLALAAGELGDDLRIIDGRPVDYLNPETIQPSAEQPCDPSAWVYEPGRVRGAKAPPSAVIDTGIGPLLTPGEDPAAATLEARALFARLPLKPRIEKSLKAVNKMHKLNRMVAVHVRAGDIVEVLRSACLGFTPEALDEGSVLDRYTEHFLRGCAPPAAYLRLVRPYIKEGYGLLFFSDTPGAAHTYEKRFPYKLVKAQDIAPVRLNPIQRALFEILMMSRCHAIIGAKSMFSSLASLIGGSPVIDARREATPDEFLDAYKRAVGFAQLPPETRAGAGEMLVRKLEQNGLMGRWNMDAAEVLRLLDAA